MNAQDLAAGAADAGAVAGARRPARRNKATAGRREKQRRPVSGLARGDPNGRWRSGTSGTGSTASWTARGGRGLPTQTDLERRPERGGRSQKGGVRQVMNNRFLEVNLFAFASPGRRRRAAGARRGDHRHPTTTRREGVNDQKPVARRRKHRHDLGQQASTPPVRRNLWARPQERRDIPIRASVSAAVQPNARRSTGPAPLLWRDLTTALPKPRY